MYSSTKEIDKHCNNGAYKTLEMNNAFKKQPNQNSFINNQNSFIIDDRMASPQIARRKSKKKGNRTPVLDRSYSDLSKKKLLAQKADKDYINNLENSRDLISERLIQEIRDYTNMPQNNSFKVFNH